MTDETQLQSDAHRALAPVGAHETDAAVLRREAPYARDPFGLRFESIIHAAHEAILTVNDQQRIVMINPAALRMFRCTAREALDADLSRFIPVRLRKAHVQHVCDFDRAGLNERPMGASRQVMGLRADGEEFPLEATISRLDVVEGMGTSRYFSALLRDTSEVCGLRAAVDNLKSQMRAIFTLAPVAIWITEGDHITFANRACHALFGATDEDKLVGRSIYSLLAPASATPIRQKVLEALAGELPVVVVQEKILRLDGVTRQIELVLARLPDHGETAVQMVITDITERVRVREDLERSRAQSRRMAAGLVAAREEERRRVARELHDELGQRLTALQMELSNLGQNQRDGQQQHVQSLHDMVGETVQAVRRIATDLRPLMLDDLGLAAALEALAQDTARRTGIHVSVRAEVSDCAISDAASIALYRMVQEALTNVSRHAGARKARIDLHHDKDDLVLTVRDNGVGFPNLSLVRDGSHGLAGIRERAEMLGGNLVLDNLPEGGARIVVRLPAVADVAP